MSASVEHGATNRHGLDTPTPIYQSDHSWHPALPKHSFRPFSQAACFYNATTIVGIMRLRHDRGGEGTVGVPPPCRQGRCLNSDEEDGKDDRGRGGINVRTMRGSGHSRHCATLNAPSHVTDVTENKTFTTSVTMPTDDRHVTVECSTLHRQINVQARSRNHCCRAKAVGITYSECVSLFLPWLLARKVHLSCAVLYCSEEPHRVLQHYNRACRIFGQTLV